MNGIWFGISGFAFIMASLSLLVALFVLSSILRVVLGILDDTQNQITDLGDIAANAVGRAAETMELVELRVGQAMGQATQGSLVVKSQAAGVGGALAGLFIASRVATMLRGAFGKVPAKKRIKRRR